MPEQGLGWLNRADLLDQAVGRDWVRDERCVAFAMGLQDRLGCRSRVRPAFRCRVNLPHKSQARPDSGLGVQVKAL